MTVGLLVMTDGRDDLLAESMTSAGMMLSVEFSHRVLHDDTGDADHRAMLAERYPTFEVIGRNERRGFSGAYRAAWRHMASLPASHVLSTEDDFMFNRPVDVGRIIEVLNHHPNLAQMALVRQAWSPEEKAAGSFLDYWLGDEATEATDGISRWVEHRRFYTTNPSVYRRSLCLRGWPDGPESEGHFSIDLFRDPDVRCGFWGRRHDEPLVHHIGSVRVGNGY